MFPGFRIAVFAAATVALSGCAGTASLSDTSPPIVSNAATAADLEQAGHWSENLYDRALAADWAGAASDLRALRTSLDRLQSTFSGDEYLVAAMSATGRVGTAITVRDTGALAREANAVTRDVAFLTSRTNPPMPSEVTLLDYYGREIEIWARAGDAVRLDKTRRETAETWARLAPRLTARGATAERDRFGALMKRLEDARTIDEYRVLATPILDEVDNLEKAFKSVP